MIIFVEQKTTPYHLKRFLKVKNSWNVDSLTARTHSIDYAAFFKTALSKHIPRTAQAGLSPSNALTLQEGVSSPKNIHN